MYYVCIDIIIQRIFRTCTSGVHKQPQPSLHRQIKCNLRSYKMPYVRDDNFNFAIQLYGILYYSQLTTINHHKSLLNEKKFWNFFSTKLFLFKNKNNHVVNWDKALLLWEAGLVVGSNGAKKIKPLFPISPFFSAKFSFFQRCDLLVTFPLPHLNVIPRFMS